MAIFFSRTLPWGFEKDITADQGCNAQPPLIDQRVPQQFQGSPPDFQHELSIRFLKLLYLLRGHLAEQTTSQCHTWEVIAGLTLTLIEGYFKVRWQVSRESKS